MSVTLRYVRDKGPAAEEVQMNGVASIEWSSSRQYLYTQGLNSCTAVAITSEHAGILAHIGPSRKNKSGDQNVIDHMQEMIKIYNTGRSKGLFPSSSSVILAAIYDGTVALPDQIAIIKKVLDRLQLPIKYEEYHVRGETEDRPTGETSLIIHCAPGNKPQFYMNERLWEVGTGDAAGSSKVASEQTRTAGKGTDLHQGQSSGQSTQDWNTYASGRIAGARAAFHRLVGQGQTQAKAFARVKGVLAKELRTTEDQAGKHLSQVAEEQPGRESTAKSSVVGSSTAGSAMQSTTSRATPPVVSPQTWASYPMRTTNEGATLLSCIIAGRSIELAASWPQGTDNRPMVWIRNSWSQTERRPNDNVLMVRDPSGALARMERPTA